METIEAFVRGRLDDPHLCEDRLMQNTHFVAVIDGASDTSGRLYGHRKGGRLAADVVQRALHLLDPDATAREAVDALTAALARGLSGYDFDYKEYRPGACVAVYSSRRREIWSVGDCHYALDGAVVYGGMAVDEAMLGFRRALIATYRAAGMTVEEIVAADPSWEALMPVQLRQHHLANSDEREFGYGVINGLPVPDRFLTVVDASGCREIVLTSDGYPFVGATLEESERYLAEDLVSDPLRVGKHPGFRPLAPGWVSFDDRAYLRVRV